jgi:Ca2+-binding RTX toxin-like protein
VVEVVAGQFQLDMNNWNYVSFAPKYLTGVQQLPLVYLHSTNDIYAYASGPTPNFGSINMTLMGSGWGDFDAAGVPHTGMVESASLHGLTYLNVTFYNLNVPIWQFIETISSSDPTKIKTLLLTGNDRIVGTPGNDWAYNQGDRLFGGDGNDVILGRGGNDTIDGGAGDDVINTVPYIFPGSNVETSHAARIDGGAGTDTWSFDTASSGVAVNLETGVSGEARAVNIENVIGGAYADDIVGSSGANRIESGDGADTVSGGAGNDLIFGGAGANILSGDDGDDNLVGGADSDRLSGGAGLDVISGGAGDDVIDGGEGWNYLYGEDGADVIKGGTDRDNISGGAGNDTVTGSGGFDDINGNMGDDSLRGGDGDDWVVGGKDNDILYGEAGDDIVYGNLGDDQGYGDDGNDIVRGGQGDDTLFGGAGNDWMSGDRGLDNLSGGAGADIFNSFIGAGFDYVHDFSVAEGDRIRLEGVTSYQVVQVGSQTEIRFGDGDLLVLLNVQAGSLALDSIFLA